MEGRLFQQTYFDLQKKLSQNCYHLKQFDLIGTGGACYKLMEPQNWSLSVKCETVTVNTGCSTFR